MKLLTGITWNHDRGLKPMLATAAEFERRSPDVRISWEARSLQQFADFSLDELAKRYDLIVLDHPHMGTAVRAGCLVPLNEHVPSQILAELQQDSVGKSYQSYIYDGQLWSLPIDAAAQVAAYRPDLLERLSYPVPRTWQDVAALASRHPGSVCLPLLPTDALMVFFTLCANSGEEPFSRDDGTVITEKTGLSALEMLQQLASYCVPESLSWSPVQMWERMTDADTTAYCPLGFGYSNYARAGYRRTLLKFTDIPHGVDGGPTGATLGGTGLGISASSKYPDIAVNYAIWVAQSACQSTTYFLADGQPANRIAWTSDSVNLQSGNFFRDTLRTLDQAYLRPNWNGFIEFQNSAFQHMETFLGGRISAEALLDALNRLAIQCRRS
ncbi:MAG: extracellular solute-binding protein [Acidobacteriota bacterium]|nr:extracellular solute-binding protein [Acidobacteriota bacterium]